MDIHVVYKEINRGKKTLFLLRDKQRRAKVDMNYSGEKYQDYHVSVRHYQEMDIYYSLGYNFSARIDMCHFVVLQC